MKNEEALAQQESEPVTWINDEALKQGIAALIGDNQRLRAELKFNTPPAQREWAGLTDDDVRSWNLPDRPTVLEFAKFVESKLKEKNA